MRSELIYRLSRTLSPYAFKGKVRLLHWGCPKNGEESIELFGYRVRLELADYIQRSMYLDAFEPHETRMVQTYLKPGMTVVDVGANVGYYTLMAASIVGEEGQVHAFEPSPYAFARLHATICNNHISQVRLVQAALGDQRGQARLFLPAQIGNHTPTLLGEDVRHAVEVPIRTLDEYVRQHNIERIDLLKLDVEGFEPNVIAGARETIGAGKIRAVLCEFNEDWLDKNGTSSAALRQTFIQYGFKVMGRTPPATRFENIFFRFQPGTS